MKKKISLPVMAVAAILLLGGCGTQMYDLSEDEENLVVQYSAHILAKYNIEQKDGMTAASSEETQETQKQDSQMPESQNTQSTDNNMASDATGETQTQEMETMPITEAIGHASGLTVSYKGYRVQNIYQEGDYFAVTPEDGNKLVVMKFEIKNKGKKKVRLDTEKLGITFYACFDGKNRIKETASLGTRSLSSYGETIRGGKKKTAVLLFQIPKDQADKISGETLYAEIKDTIYLGIRNDKEVAYINRDALVGDTVSNISRLNISYKYGKITKISWSYDFE